MDMTLTQILAALYQKDAALQQALAEAKVLRARVAALEQEVAGGPGGELGKARVERLGGRGLPGGDQDAGAERE